MSLRFYSNSPLNFCNARMFLLSSNCKLDKFSLSVCGLQNSAGGRGSQKATIKMLPHSPGKDAPCTAPLIHTAIPFAAIAAAQLLDRDTAPSGRDAPDRRGDLYTLRACCHAYGIKKPVGFSLTDRFTAVINCHTYVLYSLYHFTPRGLISRLAKIKSPAPKCQP